MVGVLHWPSVHRELSDLSCVWGLQTEPMLNTVVYFLRANAKGITEKTYETDMVAGQVSAKALEGYRALLGEVFVPVLTAQEGWGKASSKHASEMLQVPAPLKN